MLAVNLSVSPLLYKKYLPEASTVLQHCHDGASDPDLVPTDPPVMTARRNEQRWDFGHATSKSARIRPLAVTQSVGVNYHFN